MLLVLAVLFVPVSAHAVTVRDIIELSKAGLSDDILIAVIEADRTVFTLDKDQILELKKAGVSDLVILKMLRSRTEHEPRTETAVADVQPPPPDAGAIGAEPAIPPPAVTVVVPQVVVPQYVVSPYFVVPFSIWGTPHRPTQTPPPPVLAPEYRGFGRFINDGWRP